MTILRKGRNCCCNDWKDQIKQLWEKYQGVIKTIKSGGTVIYPDGNGQADITALIEPIMIDTELSTESTNAVENRAIAAAINALDENMTEIEGSIDGLSEVARTGDYDDLMNKPTIPAAQVNSDWNAASGVAQILNKPVLADVATTGSYNDLSDKPTIPTAQVNADWNATSGPAEILNKPNIPSGVTLYTSTGQNTDGAMTQKATTDALADKADTATVNTALAGKQDVLTFDPTPTANSTNPVTSNGIYNALQNAGMQFTDAEFAGFVASLVYIQSSYMQEVDIVSDNGTVSLGSTSQTFTIFGRSVSARMTYNSIELLDENQMPVTFYKFTVLVSYNDESVQKEMIGC